MSGPSSHRALEALIAAFEKTGDLDAASRARDRLREAESPTLVFVIGEGNFGKSSVVNALLGIDVAPVSRLPKTWTVDVYRPAAAGAQESATLHRTNGLTTEPLPLEDAIRLCEAAEEEAKAGRDPGISHALWTRRLPRDPGCWLVDTPGFAQFRGSALRSLFAAPGAAGETREEAIVYDTYVHRADFLIWCVKSTKLEDADTAEAIRDIARFDIKGVALLTFFDLVPSDRSEEVLDRARVLYGEHLADVIPFTTRGPAAPVAVSTVWQHLARHGVTTGQFKREREAAFVAAEVESWLARTQVRCTALAENLRRVREARSSAEGAVRRAETKLKADLRRLTSATQASVLGDLDQAWSSSQGDRDVFFRSVREHRAFRVHNDSVRRVVEECIAEAVAAMRTAGVALAFDSINLYRDGRVDTVRRPVATIAASGGIVDVGQFQMSAPEQKKLLQIFEELQSTGDNVIEGVLMAIAGSVAVAVTGLWRVLAGKFIAKGKVTEEVAAWLARVGSRAETALSSATADARFRFLDGTRRLFEHAHGFGENAAELFPGGADKALALLRHAGIAVEGPFDRDLGPCRFRCQHFAEGGGNREAWDKDVFALWVRRDVRPSLETFLQQTDAAKFAVVAGPVAEAAARAFRKQSTWEERQSPGFRDRIADIAVSAVFEAAHRVCREISFLGDFRSAYARSIKDLGPLIVGRARPLCVEEACEVANGIIAGAFKEALRTSPRTIALWCAPTLAPTLFPRSRARRSAELAAGDRAYVEAYAQVVRSVVVERTTGSAWSDWTRNW